MLAYIDPGTGSLIAQALIAGLLGGLFAIRRWIRLMFRRLIGRSEEQGRKDV